MPVEDSADWDLEARLEGLREARSAQSSRLSTESGSGRTTITDDLEV
jgi:hypothetical protein